MLLYSSKYFWNDGKNESAMISNQPFVRMFLVLVDWVIFVHPVPKVDTHNVLR
jgi:hypothetical protein